MECTVELADGLEDGSLAVGGVGRLVVVLLDGVDERHRAGQQLLAATQCRLAVLPLQKNGHHLGELRQALEGGHAGVGTAAAASAAVQSSCCGCLFSCKR